MNQFFQSALGITTLGTDRALTSMMPSGSQRLSWTLPIFHQPNSVLWVRYILTSGIFSRLEGLDPDAEGEIQLADAVQKLLDDEEVLAYRLSGTRYHSSVKLGHLKVATAPVCAIRRSGENARATWKNVLHSWTLGQWRSRSKFSPVKLVVHTNIAITSISCSVNL